MNRKNFILCVFLLLSLLGNNLVAFAGLPYTNLSSSEQSSLHYSTHNALQSSILLASNNIAENLNSENSESDDELSFQFSLITDPVSKFKVSLANVSSTCKNLHLTYTQHKNKDLFKLYCKLKICEIS